MYDYLSSVFNDFIEQLKSMKRKVASMSEGLTEAELYDKYSLMNELIGPITWEYETITEKDFEEDLGKDLEESEARRTLRDLTVGKQYAVPSSADINEFHDTFFKLKKEIENDPKDIIPEDKIKVYKIGQWKVDQETEEYVILSKPDRSVKPENKFGLLIVGFIAALFTTWWFIPIPLMLAVGYRYIPHGRIIYKK
jgi:hypothetical protein